MMMYPLQNNIDFTTPSPSLGSDLAWTETAASIGDSQSRDTNAAQQSKPAVVMRDASFTK